MHNDVTSIGRAYDTVAKEYAETFSGEHEKKPKDREILRRFAREIKGRRPVWDLGCGPGQTTKYLNDLGVDVSGLHLSGRMIEQARTRHPDINFRKGDMLNLDFDGDSLAGVVAFYAVVHFSEAQVGVAFREVWRVLQLGGIFLLTYHIGDEPIHVNEFLCKRVDMDFMFFKSAFISSCLTDSGFTDIEIIERDAYPGVEYESRRAYAFAKKAGKNCPGFSGQTVKDTSS